MEQIGELNRPTAKSSTKGRYKIKVYFHEHKQAQGKPYTFWSKPTYDRKGTSVDRLQKLVTGRWKGKVAWAGLYDCAQGAFGEQLYQFRHDVSDTWYTAD